MLDERKTQLDTLWIGVQKKTEVAFDMMMKLEKYQL